MYTVLRITASADKLDAIAPAIAATNAGISADERFEPRGKGDGWSADVWYGASWAEHATALQRFLESNRDGLRAARAAGGTLTVDVGVDPSDRPDDASWLALWLSDELLQALVAASTRILFSLYAGDS